MMVHLTDIVLWMLKGKPTMEMHIMLIPMKTPEFTELPPFAAQ